MRLNWDNGKENGNYYPRPPKGSKKWNPRKLKPLLHWGNLGIIGTFYFLDPLGGLGH